MPPLRDAHRLLLDAAVTDARAGTPSVLLVEGEPGSGKTTFLAHCRRHASDFVVVAPDVLEPEIAAAPYSVLRDLGVDLGAAVPPAALAAQAFAEWVDEHTRSGPLLLCLDDVQWADEQSIQALRFVLHRLEGTAILVALGRRSGGPASTLPLDELARSRSRLHRISLGGLSIEETSDLVRDRRPDIPDGTIPELWRHTGGNPLYLTSLLEELSASELEDLAGSWPVPRAFSSSVERRVQRLSPATRAVVEAVVVLSPGYSTLPDIVAVSGCAEPHQALQELVDADLVQVSQAGLLTARPTHALTRAAVLELIPVPRRRELHRMAATLSSGQDALDHRLAALASTDDDLAADLAERAAVLHGDSAYRQAAHYYRAAAGITASPDERRRRRLESLWDAALAGSRRALDVTAPESAAEAATVALTRFRAGEIAAALELLESVPAPQWADSDPVVRLRVAILRAYLRMLTGQATERIEEQLALADAAEASDPALRGIDSPTRGFVASRRSTSDAELVGFFSSLPDVPTTVPEELLGLLGWRAVYRLYALHVREAARDFETLVGRLGRYRDVSAFRTQLGLAQWLAGEWPLARVAAGLAADASEPLRWAPDFGPALVDSGLGRFADADRHLGVAIAMSRKAPWPEGRLMLLVARVVRVHSAGELPHEVADLVADYRDLDVLIELVTNPSDGLLLLHAGLLALWAGKPEVTRRCVEIMADTSLPAPSSPAVLAWLRGLLAKREGDLAVARELLSQAAHDDRNELLLYRAHMWADLAAVSEVADQQSLAEARALDGYQRLGAAPYVERLQAVAAASPSAAGAPTEDGFLPELTDRERDVLALLVKGLSYAQIAGELFVTRSAVGFHLSNIYAKFDVRSRHDLTAYLLRHPGALAR